MKSIPHTTATAVALLFGLGLVTAPASAQLSREICDQNEDGFIDRQEAWACGREQFGYEGDEPGYYMTQQDFLAEFEDTEDPEGLFALVDTDGDGQISPEEWDRWTEERFTRATEATEGQMAVEDYERFARGEEVAGGTAAAAATADMPDGQDFATIVDGLEEDGGFSTLVEAIESAGLSDELSDDGPFTVFAPTDEAFQKLPDDAAAKLEESGELATLLKHHIVAGEAHPANALPENLEPLAGGPLSVGLGEDAGVIVRTGDDGQWTNIDRDIRTDSGFIHVIGSVLMPSDLEEELAQQQQQSQN